MSNKCCSKVRAQNILSSRICRGKSRRKILRFINLFDLNTKIMASLFEGLWIKCHKSQQLMLLKFTRIYVLNASVIEGQRTWVINILPERYFFLTNLIKRRSLFLRISYVINFSFSFSASPEWGRWDVRPWRNCSSVWQRLQDQSSCRTHRKPFRVLRIPLVPEQRRRQASHSGIKGDQI